KRGLGPASISAREQSETSSAVSAILGLRSRLSFELLGLGRTVHFPLASLFRRAIFSRLLTGRQRRRGTPPESGRRSAQVSFLLCVRVPPVHSVYAIHPVACAGRVRGPRLAVVLIWQERDGPTVVPPKRSGFGGKSISRAITYELEGIVQLEYAETG